MRAVVIDKNQIVVKDHEDPVPGAGELLVKVRGAGINWVDLMQVAGNYPPPPGAPIDIPGIELAGEVVNCGQGVERFEPGDRVMAIVGGGAHAEFAVVNERVAMPIPEDLDWSAAGSFPEAFITAHDAIFTQAQLTVGERLLVQGGAGGVGTAALQLGQMAGARVTATVRDPKAREQVAALGVQAIPPDDFESFGPYDVILELVGAPNITRNLAALAVGGRISMIGVSAGSTTEVNLLSLMRKRARIHGSTLRSRTLEEKAFASRLVEKMVLPGFASGDLSVPIMATYPLDQAVTAYEQFGRGGKFGKFVFVSP
jgi:NADPH:quinone reductase